MDLRSSVQLWDLSAEHDHRMVTERVMGVYWRPLSTSMYMGHVTEPFARKSVCVCVERDSRPRKGRLCILDHFSLSFFLALASSAT